jgi:hypothetical protein
MEKRIKVKSQSGKDVEILGQTYDEGKPAGPDLWRGKLKTRQDMIRYLRTAERYWFSTDWFGSEKRKTPA